MSDEINYQNNPLHGLNLKSMLTEIVDHYGFELLHAYLYIHSFKTNPSIESSVKFLKKTQWAREKVEGFYLYKFKNFPKVSSDQFDLPPRDRIIPEDQSPGEPAELSLEDAQRLNEERVKRASEYDNLSGRSGGRDSAKPSSRSNDKPWAKSSAKPEYRSESRSEPKSPWKPQPKTSSDAAVKNTGPANLDPWASSRNKFK